MKTILILLCFSLTLSGISQGQFVKEYNYLFQPGPPHNVVLTIDSGYLTAYNCGFQTHVDYINFLKVNQAGDTVWTMVAENQIGSCYNSSILAIDDSTYIANGNRNFSGFMSAFLIKFDFFGNVIWDKVINDTFNLSNNLFGSDIIKTKDNQLAVLVNLGNYSALVKLDTAANIIWAKKFDSFIGIGQLVQTMDSSFVLKTRRGTDTCLLSSVDKDGNFKWRIKIPQLYHAGSMVSAENGSVILSTTDGLVKVDSYGDTAWTKILSSGISSSSIVKSNQDYILNGIFNCTGEFMVMKMDSSGTITWARKLTGIGNNCSYNINETLDGGFIMSGINWYGQSANLLLVKTDSSFNLPCVSSTPLTVQSVHYPFTIISENFNTTLVQSLFVSNNSPWTVLHDGPAADYCNILSAKEVDAFKPVVYPIPFHDQINLSNISEASIFELYNSIAEKILEGNTTNDIKVSNLSNGIYFLKLNINQRVYSYKLIRN